VEEKKKMWFLSKFEFFPQPCGQKESEDFMLDNIYGRAG
jgi:hypothetical protein